MVLGVIANVGAVLGIFLLRGPLNSGNGVIGGVAAPLGLYRVWILAVSLWWLPRDAVTAAAIHVRKPARQHRSSE